MAVIYSCFFILLLATLSSAGTVQNRAGLPTQPSQLENTNSKSPGRRIMHRAFENAGRTKGLEIWRIENFEPVVYPKQNYGKFYTGDSFIVLNTVEGKDKKLSWDVHFWLGSETSTDEAGTAAILTVQLDDLLNGAPVQHREVQDHESQLFLSYFKNGVRYEQGGVGSGFKHVQTNAQGEKRLFQVKGKRNVRVRQVNLSVSSMNKGDCFILDAGNEIYVYVGEQAKRVEKLKAISAANQIRDQDHNGRSKVQIIDEFGTDVDKQTFFDVLGSGSPSQVPEESTAEEDGTFETTDSNSVTLYKVTDSSGKLEISPVSQKPLRQEMLNTLDCFVLDTGSGIYVWVGRGATPREKADSMSKAQEFLRTKKYPAWTQIHRIVEGGESAPFKQYFATWRDVGMSHTRLIRSALDYDTDDSEFNVDDSELDVDDSEFDMDDSVLKILKERGGRAIGFMPDNGKNSLGEITHYYKISGNNHVNRVILPYKNTTSFYGSSVYTIDYEFESKHGESGFLIYVWVGNKSSSDLRERAFEDAMNFAAQKNAILIRTVQNYEPRHFLKMFKGNLFTTIMFYESIAPRLFHIRGTDETSVVAVEVKADSSSLSSADVFGLLIKQSNIGFIWFGQDASNFKKKGGLKVFSDWSDVELEVVEEGAEPDRFWEALNGKGTYERRLPKISAPLLEQRLFHCRLIGNRIKFEDVNHFGQDDLDVDDIMLMDVGDEIYVWVGSGASADENSKIFDMAKEYIKSEPTDRTIDSITVIFINQDNEPHSFKQLFPSWVEGYWKDIPSYDDVRNQVYKDNERIDNNEV